MGDPRLCPERVAPHGRTETQKATRLVNEIGIGKLPLDIAGWLLAVLQKGKAEAEFQGLLRHLQNRVTETAAAAHFATSYSDGAHVLLHSDRRADGIILDALIETRSDDRLIAKVVRGLLAHRSKGRWGNTQENAFVLLALDHYFRVFEKVTPDFVARVWLGGGFAGEHTFKGRTTERARIDIPMAFLGKPGKRQDLVLDKQGPGRLYYRIGMRYAPKDLSLAPADYGFAVERTYEHVDDPSDVRRGDDGVWRIRAGARVRVRLKMVAPSRRYHVALVDPLPAGLEALNPELKVQETVPAAEKEKGKQARYW